MIREFVAEKTLQLTFVKC